MKLERLVSVLIATFLALLGAFMFAPAAEAKELCHYKVGCIRGEYQAASEGGNRDYVGAFSAAANRCVVIERKLSSGAWTSGFVEPDPYSCRTYDWGWVIDNDAAVSHTVAIRLRVYSGTSVGSYINLCNTKSQCLAMR